MYINIFTRSKIKEAYNTMAVATTIPRYDKNQILFFEDKEIRLIDHLKELRIGKKITKKRISNLIKHNDYWYSQIERSGKNGDDNRQRTIYRNDLVKIISIIKYDAATYNDLETLNTKSEIYIDKIIKAVPLKESIKKLELYQLSHVRTVDEQNRLLNSLLSTQERLLRHTFDSLSGDKDKDFFLDALKNLNLSLKIDPLFIIYLIGLPYADFLYESKQEKLYSLFREIIKIIDDITTNSDKNNALSLIQKKITEYTGKDFEDGQKKNFIPLPPEQWFK